jgi:hypothetical protein
MRIYVIAIFMMIFAGSAFAVDGTNLPGRDYANFPAPSAFVCRTSAAASLAAKPIPGSNRGSRDQPGTAGSRVLCPPF